MVPSDEHQILYPYDQLGALERLSWIVGKKITAFVTLAETEDGEVWAVDLAGQDPRFTADLMRQGNRAISKTLERGRP